jgi:tRNA-2-methylthio-N6-dimethylallyladenosine synthase
LQRRIQLELNAQAVGQAKEVLVDSWSRRRPEELAGRTTGNTVVNLPGPGTWLGKLVRVRIERAGANSLWGEPIEAVS